MTTETQINPWVSRANALACAILAVAIGYVVVQIVYLFIDPLSQQPAPSLYAHSEAAASRGGAKVDIDTSVIPSLNLFGKVGQVAVQQKQPEQVDAPKTRLPLELQAVFVAPNEDKSSAMIAESRRDPELYHVGDKVQGGVSLAGVYQDRVLLNRNGSMEALFFPESTPGGMTRAGDPGSSGARRPSQRSVSPTARRPSEPRARPTRNPAEPQAAMADQMLGSLQEQVKENPDQVLGQFGLAANNGRGYTVSANANPMLASLGVKSGDVILEVNGRAIGDPSQDISFIEEVMNEGSIRVSIERNGKQFETQVSLPGM